MWRSYAQSAAQLDPRFGRVTQTAGRYPRWVFGGTALAAAPMLIVLAIGAVLLLLAALVVGGLVFWVLGGTARLLGLADGPAGGAGPGEPVDDGRVNVRVLER